MKLVIAIVGLSGVGKSEVASVLSEMGLKDVTDFVGSLNEKDAVEALSMLSAPASVYAELHNADEQTVATLHANGVHVIEVVRTTEESPDPVRQFPEAASCIFDQGDDLEAFRDYVRAGATGLINQKTADAPVAFPSAGEPPAINSAPAPTA